MFSDVFPSIARKNLLKKGGKILLPNLNCTQDKMEEYKSLLSQYYIISTISNPRENVLYLATETCKADLLKCPDNLTNETQIAPLLNHSDHPFYVLELRDEFLSSVSSMTVPSFSTPTKAKRGRPRTPVSPLIPRGELARNVTTKKIRSR